MVVTQKQIDKTAADFTALLDDITTMLPSSPQLTMAVMIFKMTEATVLTLMHQYMILPPGTAVSSNP